MCASPSPIPLPAASLFGLLMAEVQFFSSSFSPHLFLWGNKVKIHHFLSCAGQKQLSPSLSFKLCPPTTELPEHGQGRLAAGVTRTSITWWFGFLFIFWQRKTCPGPDFSNGLLWLRNQCFWQDVIAGQGLEDFSFHFCVQCNQGTTCRLYNLGSHREQEWLL